MPVTNGWSNPLKCCSTQRRITLSLAGEATVSSQVISYHKIIMVICSNSDVLHSGLSFRFCYVDMAEVKIIHIN